jgi:hypothetical protein
MCLHTIAMDISLQLIALINHQLVQCPPKSLPFRLHGALGRVTTDMLVDLVAAKSLAMQRGEASLIRRSVIQDLSPVVMANNIYGTIVERHLNHWNCEPTYFTR